MANAVTQKVIKSDIERLLISEFKRSGRICITVDCVIFNTRTSLSRPWLTLAIEDIVNDSRNGYTVTSTYQGKIDSFGRTSDVKRALARMQAEDALTKAQASA